MRNPSATGRGCSRPPTAKQGNGVHEVQEVHRVHGVRVPGFRGSGVHGFTRFTSWSIASTETGVWRDDMAASATLLLTSLRAGLRPRYERFWSLEAYLSRNRNVGYRRASRTRLSGRARSLRDAAQRAARPHSRTPSRGDERDS